jgi:hypothetical protein
MAIFGNIVKLEELFEVAALPETGGRSVRRVVAVKNNSTTLRRAG